MQKNFPGITVVEEGEKECRTFAGTQESTLFEEAIKKAGQAGMVGRFTGVMRELLLTAYKLAGQKINILICGETGTGKELLARFIHLSSPRAPRIFLPVNCGALAESLVESDLFGHEKGAFTGADRRRLGCFEMADRGTIFLDEVGDAPPSVQARLLRVLETGQFQRVGGDQIITVDVRVLAATNIDLEEAVKKRRFREDLYYRLNAVLIRVPPLRRRTEDILPLAGYFLGRAYGVGSQGISLSAGASDIILNYHWPGNVRELSNVILQSAALAEGNVILPRHLPERMAQSLKHSFDISGEPLKLPQPARLRELEKQAIISALQHCGGNVKAASSLLGIGRATLHRKIKQYGLSQCKSVRCTDNE